MSLENPLYQRFRGPRVDPNSQEVAMDWENIGGGLQVRYHTSRKFGRRFDRYIMGRYQLEGKRQIVAFGWESEWVAAERARMLADGDTGPRMSFLEYCQGELARLKQNALKGVGPVTLKEDRELALAKAKEEEEARAAEEKAGVTFGAYFKEKYLPVAKTHKRLLIWSKPRRNPRPNRSPSARWSP
jgi:hypothetical protein